MSDEAEFVIEFCLDAILTFFRGNNLLTQAFQLRLKTRNGSLSHENAFFRRFAMLTIIIITLIYRWVITRFFRNTP